MKTYTITEQNSIIAVDAPKSESISGAEQFSSESELVSLSASWPASRLVEVWNNLPGVTPVKKFTDRTTGATRIWKAIQAPDEAIEPSPVAVEDNQTENPGEAAVAITETEVPASAEEATVAEQAAHVAPADATSDNECSPASQPRAVREGTKTATLLDLLKREEGATMTELLDATGWQVHSLRGFLSGTVNKKMGLQLTTSKDASGERRYFVHAC